MDLTRDLPIRRGARILAVLVALAALGPVVGPAAASAETTTRGSTLTLAPAAVGEGNDCDAYFALGGPVNNPFGATTCTYTQGFVYGTNPDTDPRTGFVPSDGVINTVTVKVGANPAALQFVVLRQITNAQLGAVSGEPKCCFFVGQTAPVQPAPNTTTTFTVNLPVENNRQPNIITQDAIGFSAHTGGTLPIALVPGQFSPAFFTPGGLTSSSFHPQLGPEHGTNTGGAFASGHQGGLDVLLQYTFTPAPATAGPGPGGAGPGGGGGGGATQGPGGGTTTGGTTTGGLVLRPTDVTTIGGSVLRPIGGALDVVLNCLQATCAGTVNVLSRSPVAAASKAAKKKIRSLGSAKFALRQGSGRKAKIKLNRLGRQLAKRASTKVTVVVDLGPTGTTRRNLTLKKGKPR